MNEDEIKRFAAKRVDPPTIRCQGCGVEIDPDCCGCGGSKDGHGSAMSAGHPFIPAGCNCFREPKVD